MPVKFCKLCDNLLYPKTVRAHPKHLYFGCRNCAYEEQAGEDRMVYANELLSVVTEKAGVTEDVEMDPTLPRSDMECPTCHAKECVFFQDQSKRKITNMRLFYKCISCKSVFTDKRADEGHEKDVERQERERRINDEKAGKAKKEAESAPPPVQASNGQAGQQPRRAAPEENESDGEY